MEFIGTMAIDQGGMNLNSYNTQEMSFGQAAEWYSKATEYVRSMVAVTPSIREAQVLIHDSATVTSIRTQPIDGIMFRRNSTDSGYRELVIKPMND